MYCSGLAATDQAGQLPAGLAQGIPRMKGAAEDDSAFNGGVDGPGQRFSLLFCQPGLTQLLSEYRAQVVVGFLTSEVDELVGGGGFGGNDRQGAAGTKPGCLNMVGDGFLRFDRTRKPGLLPGGRAVQH